ncbi:SH3 domain-containing protein [Desulfonema limicola]|uniref:SH3 domain-containing protein n=2 Tax=Desulfonema limicola TaxID=45656 RepID=A0A975B3M1_9BACT|nr:SH3 domain-containing protein [Desulfonema limicola]
MKWFISILIWSLMLQGAAMAKTMYITDNIKITMRRGAGMAYKVIAEPSSGDSVEILAEQPPWTNVQLSDGKEGWVLNQFLTSKQPKEVQLNLIKEKQESLLKEVDVLNKENIKLKEENKKLSQQSVVNLAERDEAVKAYEALKQESKDFLQVKDQYNKTLLKLEEQQKKAAELEAKMSDLKWQMAWFIGGAGVFLTGFILGRINIKTSGRRNSYLR